MCIRDRLIPLLSRLLGPAITIKSVSVAKATLALFFRLHGDTPVSYTHLDVYKRQVEEFTSDIPNVSEEATKDLDDNGISRRSHRRKPVSYTHL